MKVIPGSFRYWTLLIVLGNSIVSYLFEKIVVYKVQVCNLARLEKRREDEIGFEMSESRNDLDNYFKLKSQKTSASNGGNEVGGNKTELLVSLGVPSYVP